MAGGGTLYGVVADGKPPPSRLGLAEDVGGAEVPPTLFYLHDPKQGAIKAIHEKVGNIPEPTSGLSY